MKCAMSIFINNIPVSIIFFTSFNYFFPLAVALIQVDFENRLNQHNWKFTLGLGLVLNKMHLLLTSPWDILINVTLNVSIINVSFAAASPIQNFHTDNFSV